MTQRHFIPWSLIPELLGPDSRPTIHQNGYEIIYSGEKNLFLFIEIIVDAKEKILTLVPILSEDNSGN